MGSLAAGILLSPVLPQSKIISFSKCFVCFETRFGIAKVGLGFVALLPLSLNITDVYAVFVSLVMCIFCNRDA